MRDFSKKMEKAGIQRNNGSSFYAQNGEILQKIEIERGTQRQGDKRSAPQGYLLRGTAADLIASHAPLRTRRHKARPASCQHEARGSNGDRSPLGTPFSSIFRRATKDGVPEGRWMTQMYEKSAATFVTAPIFTSKFPSTFAIPAPRTLSAPAYGRYPVAPKPPPAPPPPSRWPRPGSS